MFTYRMYICRIGPYIMPPVTSLFSMELKFEVATVHPVATSDSECSTAVFVVRKQTEPTLWVLSAASSMTESYKHCLPCHPTMAAQKCPWPQAGSQVAGGAGQNQEA